MIFQQTKMWHTVAPQSIFWFSPCEIETADGKIIRGVFLSVDRFRSEKNIDFYEWLRWREVSNQELETLEV